MWKHGDETAAGDLSPLEYGGGGFITALEGKTIAAPPISFGERGGRKYIQGYALRWRSLIHRGGDEYAYFLPNSIKSPMSGPLKQLLFDHNEGEVICTTENGLILFADEHGLAMRAIPPDTSSGRKAIETVRAGDRTALSVGVLMHGDEHVQIDGLDVKLVRNATLQEVSLVHRGACRPAFCQLVDADDCGTLVEESRSLKLLSDGAAKGFLDAARECERALRAQQSC